MELSVVPKDEKQNAYSLLVCVCRYKTLTRHTNFEFYTQFLIQIISLIKNSKDAASKINKIGNEIFTCDMIQWMDARKSIFKCLLNKSEWGNKRKVLFALYSLIVAC